MKIFRGPAGESLEDPSYVCVSEHDLSTNEQSWTRTYTIRFNIAKDKNAQKQSAIYVEIDEADVLMLHHTLLEGLQTKLASLEASEKLMQVLRKKITTVGDTVEAASTVICREYEKQVVDAPTQESGKAGSALNGRQRIACKAEWPFPTGSRPR
ncbi:hypothetical protein N234_17158 [Ralstonia pickettii DTP0602]|nr:hypothetical protein N234_17158 [Ralstonia pickettii DTP0602]